MESDEETATAIVALLLVKRNKKKRRINLGLYEMLVQELRC